ncbi:MAG: hypothetical protein WBA57_09730 [Elainellaceae cyanobacterium]
MQFISPIFSKNAVKTVCLASASLLGAIALAACGGEPSSTADSTSEAPSSEETSSPAADSTPEENSTTSATSTPAPNANATDSVNIGTFTSDDLFAAGGGGCGMSLKAVGGTWQEGGLFFHGLEDDPAFMVIDGAMKQLSRADASGEAFYGQRIEQSFVNDDGSLLVEVSVTLGEPGEIESVNIPEGLLLINQAGTQVEIPVEGDAGC